VVVWRAAEIIVQFGRKPPNFQYLDYAIWTIISTIASIRGSIFTQSSSHLAIDR
jgi:hypothetical protein